MPVRVCPRNWTSGCRCEACHARLLEESKLRRAVAAARAGRMPEARVSAGASRRQLAKLRARGMSIRVISERSGVSVGALQHLAQRDRSHVSLETARRLAAVR